jgi:hypothetical protein
VKAHVLVASYDRYGGHSISTIADFLEQASKTSECGIAIFEATVCFRTVGRPKPTLEGRYSDFHAEMDRLPQFRWERAKGRFSIRYESRLGTADDLLGSGSSSRAVLQSALSELTSLLRAHEASLRRKAGLPLDSFLALALSLEAMIPATDEELEVLRRELADRRRVERAALPWWEQLGIDWSDYHPRARAILDAAFFWSEGDDYAPHGNDTGADLFSAFRKWRPAHRSSPAMQFLGDLLTEWGFSGAWKDRPITEWDADVEMELDVHDQAVLALAFALIKLEGACPEAPRQAALQAIARQLDGDIAAHFGWRTPPERVAALQRLATVLEGLGPS